MNFTENQKGKALKLSEKFSSEFNEDETEEFAKKHTKEAWYHNFKLLFDMITDKESVKKSQKAPCRRQFL